MQFAEVAMYLVALGLLWWLMVSPLTVWVLAHVKPEWLIMHPVFRSWLPDDRGAEGAAALVVQVLQWYRFRDWPLVTKYLAWGYAHAGSWRGCEVYAPTTAAVRTLQEWYQYAKYHRKAGYPLICSSAFRDWQAGHKMCLFIFHPRMAIGKSEGMGDAWHTLHDHSKYFGIG